MSTLISHITTSPHGKEEECAQFAVTAVPEQFTIFDVMTVGTKYTFNCWLKSDEPGIISINGTTIETTSDWERYTVTFIADGTNLVIDFTSNGVYYIYHPKLEIGTVATDWSIAIEDIDERLKEAANAASQAQNATDDVAQRVNISESLIEQLRNAISMLVVDNNGGTLLTQTAEGWTFSLAETSAGLSAVSTGLSNLQEDTKGLKDSVDELKDPVEDFKNMASYVKIITDGDQPCIELGTVDVSTGLPSPFKLLITNTEIQFMEEQVKAAYISNQSMYIKKAVIEEELTQGGFQWIVRKKSDGTPGNMGVVWKGVTS